MNATRVENKIYRICLQGLLAFSVLMTGCGHGRNLRPEEYVKAIENTKNGLLVKKEMNDLFFLLQYKPSDYIISRELMRGNLKFADVATRRNELNGYLNFTFRVMNKKGKDPVSTGLQSEQEYSERQDYLSSQAEKDFILLRGEDSIHCAVCHYERTYNLSPYATLVLSFPNRQGKDNSDMSFLYKDHVFGAGNIWMKISESDLKDIPTVSYN